MEKVPFKGYKTIMVVISFLAALWELPDVQALIATYPKECGTIMAVVMALLRVFTTTPMLQSNPKDGEQK